MCREISSITDELETQNTYRATVQKKERKAFHMINEGFLFSSWPAKPIWKCGGQNVTD